MVFHDASYKRPRGSGSPVTSILIAFFLIGLVVCLGNRAWGDSIERDLSSAAARDAKEDARGRAAQPFLADHHFSLLSDLPAMDILLPAPAVELSPYLCRQPRDRALDGGGMLAEEEEPPEEKEFLLLAAYKEDETARDSVERHIFLYTTSKRRTFEKWLQRSGRYLDTIKAILKEEGLPEELVYLPLIESGYSTDARSSADAVGPWQFMESTGKSYDLKTDYWRDERRDPIKSTVAAARYLKDLYDRFESWPLALAAYNAGEGRVRRALRKSRSDNYWRIIRTKYLKKETRNYVSKFIAAGIIASDPEKYGFTDIDYHAPMRFDEVVIKSPASLSFIARCSGTTVEAVRELNPELKRWCTPPDLREYTVRVPEGRGERFRKCFDDAPPAKRMPKIPYIIKKGDTLWEIAESFQVSRRELHALNKGIDPKRLRPGSIIYLPPSDDFVDLELTPKTPYIIKKGDTLWEIARSFKVSRKELLALNRGIDPKRLRPGSIIYLPLKRSLQR